MPRLVYLLFFCSGASGLIYEVIWVREFGSIFGNTVFSASLVTSVFMCGLGAGSYLGGRWADRRHSARSANLVRAYGYAELAIATLGFAISLLLPHLGAVSSAVSAYTRDASGWYVLSGASQLARYAITTLLLAPVTFLMGATLTLLVRHSVQGQVAQAGWRIGVLYGVNTGGAAAGAFLTDYAFVPAVGLHGSQMIAVLLNLVAAAGALGLAGRPRPYPPGEAAAPVTAEAPHELAPDARLAIGAGTAIFLSGVSGMGMEIVWFRHIDILLQGYRAVFSLLLTVILIGIWFGAVGGGLLHRRVGRPVLLFVLAQTGFMVSTLLGLATADIATLIDRARGLLAAAAGAELPGRAHLWFNIRPVLLEVAVPALFMGCAFPLANASAQVAGDRVGRRAGGLYLANTLGAVVGALSAGFVLLPALGMQQTTTVLMLAAVLSMGAMCLGSRSATAPTRWPAGAALLASVAVAGMAVTAWGRLPADHVLARSLWPLKERTIAVREGINEVVVVTELVPGVRRLVTNGFSMSANGYVPQRYMRAQAHIPLLLADAPARALVICFGVGNTAHAASLHPSLRRLEIVDLSRNILDHAEYFAATNGGVLRDPKVTVYVNDGRQHLRMRPPATYDLITLEPPPITFAGVGALYSREFYALVQSRLTAAGYATQWLPLHQVPEVVALGMVRAFVDVFPRSVLLSGFGHELILVGTNAPRLQIDPARVRAQLGAMPAVRDDLGRVDLGTATEMVGTFVLSGEELAMASDGYPAATDDRPIMEYATASRLTVHHPSGALSRVGNIEAWCPTCFVNGRAAPEVPALDHYLGALAGAYRAPVGAAPPGSLLGAQGLSRYLRAYADTLAPSSRGTRTP